MKQSVSNFSDKLQLELAKGLAQRWEYEYKKINLEYL